MGNKFIDLFAGAGGLSEGFIRAGYQPVAHVEIDEAAANTLKTRAAYHWLRKNEKSEIYDQYIQGEISRNKLWSSVPETVISSVINKGIGAENNPDIFNQIDSLLNRRKIDLIIGGPPCQAYSIAGRSRDKNRMIGDSRNYLYTFYNEFLLRYKPKYFVFENVLGIQTARDMNGGVYFEHMKELFKKSGYSTDFRIIDASDYGIPQKRKRIILVGKKGHSLTYPCLSKMKTTTTINEMFRDLPYLNAGEGSHKPQKYQGKSCSYLKTNNLLNKKGYVTWHISRPNTKKDLEIYQRVVNQWDKNKIRLKYNELPQRLISHKNHEIHLDRFKVVAGELTYAHTVVAHISKDGHYYIHPDIKQNRSITPREAARIQTFPDDFYFEGASEKPSRTAAFKQIGNAVPVLLGEKIAQKLKQIW